MVTAVFLFLACLPLGLSVCLSPCFLPATPGLAVVCRHEEVPDGRAAGGCGTRLELADVFAAGPPGGGGADGAGGAAWVPDAVGRGRWCVWVWPPRGVGAWAGGGGGWCGGGGHLLFLRGSLGLNLTVEGAG